MSFVKIFPAICVLPFLAACAGVQGEEAGPAVTHHLGAPKGAIGRDHSVLNDDLIRAAQQQRRKDIATP